MTRAQIRTRVSRRADRADSVTLGLIDEWMVELIREVEREHPWAYTKKSQTAPIPANVKSFALPGNLILHHPFTLLLEDSGTSASPEYSYLVKVEENHFDMHFPAPNTTGSDALYWKLTGGVNGTGFDVYPVMERDATLKIASGHYYTETWTDDSDENWLSINQPDLIVEGVAAKLFEHYGEPGKAERAYFRYQELLQKAKSDQRKMDTRGRLTRVKTLSDFPLAIAQRKKSYGY